MSMALHVPQNKGYSLLLKELLEIPFYIERHLMSLARFFVTPSSFRFSQRIQENLLLHCILLTFSYTEWHSDNTISAGSTIQAADEVREIV